MVMYSPAFGGVDQLIVIQESGTLCDLGAMLHAVGEDDFERIFLDDCDLIVIHLLDAGGARHKVDLIGLADASRLLHIIGTERAIQYRRWFHQDVEPIVKAEVARMMPSPAPDENGRESILAAMKTQGPGGCYVWDGEDEDDRPASAEELRDGVDAYRRILE